MKIVFDVVAELDVVVAVELDTLYTSCCLAVVHFDVVVVATLTVV